MPLYDSITANYKCVMYACSRYSDCVHPELKLGRVVWFYYYCYALLNIVRRPYMFLLVAYECVPARSSQNINHLMQ